LPLPWRRPSCRDAEAVGNTSMNTVSSLLRAVVLVSAIALLFGCSGRKAKTCDKPREYQFADSIPPLQVPEDLDAVDSAIGLKIPDPAQDAPQFQESIAEGSPCLEAPPDYFDTSIN
jgi:hypothetical protein